jgi:PAS domain S-box-containing protein
MGAAPMSSGPLSVVAGSKAPPVKWGLVVAASLIGAETLVVYPLKLLAPASTLGVVYLLGVVVVATVWGFWLAAATSLISVVAFDYIHVPPALALTPTQAGDWVALTVYVGVALLASTLSGVARSRAVEAYQRRRDFQRFFDLSSDLLGIGGVDGYLKRMNPAFEQALGYSQQELLAQPFGDIIHPDDRNRTRELVDDLARHGGPAQLEYRCIRKDGSVVWLQWNAVSDQGLLHVAGRDVTQRRREQRDLSVLAELQASLRRVATLVAQGVDPTQVFSAVAAELAQCLGVQHATLFRYESDGAFTLLAVRHEAGLMSIAVGERFAPGGDNVAAMVYDTGRTARMDSLHNARGRLVGRIRQLGIRSGVGAPIIVDGRLWGVAIVGSARPEPLPPDTESRVEDFADLVATAIASAQTHADLTASRARIVAAADDARRRFERDLHDGAQQQLVSLGLQLRGVEAAVPAELQPLKERISGIVSGLAGVSAEIQEISRGIHPAILSKGGLAPALKTLARRSAVPVKLELGVDGRLPESVEVAAYYVVAEALTNAAKHARASQVTVCVQAHDADLHLSIRDDGIGGADLSKGSGLIGLIDRVSALGGTMAVTSERGSGTSLLAKIPLEIQ